MELRQLKLAVLVENKIDAAVGDGQLSRYKEIVRSRYPDFRHLYILLTPDGIEPDDDDYNLPEAQRLGVLTNQKLARIRRQELEPTISKLRAKGATTGAEIARLLNARGLRTPRGQPWTDANIRRVLRDMDQVARDRSAADVEYRAKPSFGSW